MQVSTTFKNIEHTESLDQKIQEKSTKLKKYFHGKINVHWVCWVEDINHWAEVLVTGDQVKIHAKAKTDGLYKTLDEVVKKVEKQLEKKNTKVKAKIHRKG